MVATIVGVAVCFLVVLFHAVQHAGFGEYPTGNLPLASGLQLSQAD
jgi:hypothetical protein